MIEYVTYKKKRYPIRVGYIALEGLKADTGKEFTELQKNPDFTDYESLLYHAMIAGAHAMDVEMEFERDQIKWVLDECLMDFIELIPKFFPQNKAGQSVGKPQGNRQTRRAQEKK